MSDLRVERPPVSSDATDVAPPVRVLIDAPRRRNALTAETVDHLLAVLEEEPGRTVMLGSTTPGVFSAGADLGVDDASRTRLSDRLYACYEAMVTRPGIVVAVVEGAAVGGGAQLCAAADLRVCSPLARWRWAGPGHGLAVGAWILPDLVGRGRALDLTLTGRWLNAEEAVRSGFATRLGEIPWQIAEELTAALAQSDAGALARVKSITTQPLLLERLRRERQENRESWSGAAPSPREAAAQSRLAGGEGTATPPVVD
jgi:enoyl-CoA hydratase